MAERVNVHVLREMDAAARAALLVRAETDLRPFEEKVRPVVEAVRREGDAALARFAREFDHAPVEPGRIAATEAEFAAAEAALPAALRAAMAEAAGAIRRFHEAQMPGEIWLREMRPGVLAGERVRPLASVACYVPRGKGTFPSAALMTAIPARVAGVSEVAILTPPGPDGSLDAATLHAARLAGVRHVFRAGGAQGIAAAAYGTETVPRAVKIVGPGSPWVSAAKRLVSHLVDVGSPAGPSESVILADPAADGRLAALDLLIEAEHGPDSSAFLVTWSAEVVQAAIAALPGFWARMGEPRAAWSAAVLGGPAGGIVLARDRAEAVAFVNDHAPEHLQILAADPLALLGEIENAGEILLGPHTPSVLANYVIGPSHVLPTGGAARSASPLGVHDFLKRSSLVRVSEAGYAALAPHARAFAAYEGFDAHANAVSELREALLGGAG